MLITPHAVAGATLGAIMPSPWLAIPLAVASHYALDSVPHWQETLAPYTPTRRTYVRIVLDAALALSFVLLIMHWRPDHASTVWVSAIFANAPDADSLFAVAPSLKRGVLKAHWDWHCKIQRETASWVGVLPQLLVMGSGLLLVLASKRYF